MARSGQPAAARRVAACRDVGISPDGALAYPASSRLKTSGQMSQQRACPWHRSGSTVTLMAVSLVSCTGCPVTVTRR